MNKRELLQNLLSGKISYQDFTRQLQATGMAIIGVANAKPYGIDEDPADGDLIEYSDPETGERLTITCADFKNMAGRFDRQILVVIVGGAVPPVLSEAEITEI